MTSRKLSRDALVNKHPFGLKTKGSARMNLESSQVPTVGLQHLGAVCMLGGKRPGMNTLRNLVNQINLEGREPTDIEKDFLVSRCKSLFSVPSLTYDDLVRPKGTWNMEADDGDDEEDETPEEPPEPTEPTEDEEEQEEGAGDPDNEDAGASDEPAEPEEPADGEGEDSGDLEEPTEPSSSEADIQPIEEDQTPAAEPEHKVNVVMRAGEVEINIEDAMDKYQVLADGLLHDIDQYTESEYLRIKSTISDMYVNLVQLRSQNAMRKGLEIKLELAYNDVSRLGEYFSVMKHRLTHLSQSFVRLSSDLYQRDIPAALTKYEEGFAADGADIIKGAILAIANLQEITSVFTHKPIAAEDGIEVALVIPATNPDSMSSQTVCITPHELTQVNNIACDLMSLVKGSTFLKDFDQLALRAKNIQKPQEESGAEQDPYVYVTHFGAIFHMQNVYVMQGILLVLEQLHYLNTRISELPDA